MGDDEASVPASAAPPGEGSGPVLALELKGITKQFPGVLANDHIDLDLRRGEVHAVLGENGAGKSTLMHVLSGLYAPDEGSIFVDGRERRFSGPRDAIAAGIGMVHQHFMLIPVMTVTENIVLGREPARGPFLDARQARQDVAEVSQRYGLEIDPAARVADLSVGLQQRVEILKAFYRGARILILDEPTAMLTPQESRELFRIMRELAASGVSIFFISHKLDEVMEVAQRVSVMRQGRRVATLDAADTSPAALAELMVGRSVLLEAERTAQAPGAPILSVQRVERAARDNRAAVHDVSFEVRAGEIFGLAGIEGNGQQELVEMVVGLLKADTGSVALDGRDVHGETARQLFDRGLAYIPPDRQAEGLVLDFTVAENLALKDHFRPPVGRHGLLNMRAMLQRAKTLTDAYDVRPADPSILARNLSGGNQQKVILAREVSGQPRLLVAAQPTRGLDVGAIEFVHKRLLALRAAGTAVLLSSLELDEILALSDRIGVVYRGRIVAVLDADEATREGLGALMTGALASREVSA